MLKLCENDTELRWLRDVILFAACTGMRISEIASVRWTDIQYDRQHEPVFVVLTDERSSSRREEQRRIKGRRGRHVPIHPRVRELLGRLHHSQDGRLFHGPKGGRLKPDTVRNVFVREVIAVLKSRFSTPTGEIGFEHARLHSFRHFFVSQAFMQGAREGEVKDWVGHKDSRVVELYRHLSKDESRYKMEQLDLLGDHLATDVPSRGTTGPSGPSHCGESQPSQDASQKAQDEANRQ